MGTVDKLTELQYRRSKIENGGGEAKIKKQHDSGKMTARERINALMDDEASLKLMLLSATDALNLAWMPLRLRARA